FFSWRQIMSSVKFSIRSLSTLASAMLKRTTRTRSLISMTRTTRRSSKRKNILLVQTYKHDTQDFWCCLCERNIELLLPAGEIQGWPVMSIIKHIKKHIEKYH